MSRIIAVLGVLIALAVPSMASANSGVQISLISAVPSACVSPTQNTGPYFGSVQFTDSIVSPASPGVAGIVQIKADWKTSGLASGNYTAEIARVTLDSSGAVTGCESLTAGTFYVPRNGVAHYYGTVQFSYGVETPTQSFVLRLTGNGRYYLSQVALLRVAS